MNRTRTFLRLVSIVGLVGLVDLSTRAAYGQDDPRKTQAAPFFEEGRRYAEQQMHGDAIEKFRKAHALYPSPNTLYNIAREEHLAGRRLDALRDYREALRNPVLLPAIGEHARRFVAELEAQVARVKIVGPSGARVTVGANEYTLPLAEPIDVEAGPVTVDARQGGQAFHRDVVTTAGQTTTIDIGPKTALASEPPPAGGDDGTFWGIRSIAGIGALTLAAGAGVFFIVAKGDSSSAQDEADGHRASLGAGSPDSQCAGQSSAACTGLRSALEDRNDADARASTAAAITIGAGVVGAALVVSAIVWPHRKTSSSAAAPSPRFAPLVGRDGAGLFFQSSF